MNQFVIRESIHHEQCKIDTPGEIALQDRVADMTAPHGQTLALPLLEIAASYDSPFRIAREDPARRFHLVAYVHRNDPAQKFGNTDLISLYSL